MVLTSSAERGYSETIELTNLELRAADGKVVPQAAVHVRVTRLLADKLYEVLRVRNYHDVDVDLTLDLLVDADFADLFEVRGARRRRRGRRLPPRGDGASLTFSYEGLDDVVRSTVVTFARPADAHARGAGRATACVWPRRTRPAAPRHRRRPGPAAAPGRRPMQATATRTGLGSVRRGLRALGRTTRPTSTPTTSS